MSLTFIGVLYGESRIRKGIEKLKPDIITLEMSLEYWRLLKKEKLENAFAEVEIAVNYCVKEDKDYYFIDKPLVIQILKTL